MKRIVRSLLMFTGLVGLVGLAVRADEVTFFDRAKKAEAKLTVTITEETPAKISYKGIGGSKDIKADDIIDVFYEVRPALRQDYRAADNKEKAIAKAKPEDRKKAVDEALKEYTAVHPKLADSKGAQRQASYKIAVLRARLAEIDAAQADAAIDELTKFLKENSGGWQTVPAGKLLAKLQISKGDFDGAQKTYEELAKTAKVADETKQECNLLAAQVLTQARKYKEARSRLEQAKSSFAAGSPEAQRVSVYLSACNAAEGKFPEAIKELETVIAKSDDAGLKALAYNTLGDCYRGNKQPKDAMWAYLWVDVIYNQDKEEHGRALENLVKVFEEMKDENRAKQYKERLQKSK